MHTHAAADKDGGGRAGLRLARIPHHSARAAPPELQLWEQLKQLCPVELREEAHFLPQEVCHVSGVALDLLSLLQRSHRLLRDELLGTLHAIAVADVDVYFAGAVPQFIQECPRLTPPQRQQLAQRWARAADSSREAMVASSSSFEDFLADCELAQAQSAGAP